jgi:arginine/lysine/ornithine decarboxylase
MAMELALQLKRLSQVDKFPFHMPGHKNEFPELFGQFDPTELPGLDNLHSPQDIIKKAQARVADIYGVAKTYFLVNGWSGQCC